MKISCFTCPPAGARPCGTTVGRRPTLQEFGLGLGGDKPLIGQLDPLWINLHTDKFSSELNGGGPIGGTTTERIQNGFVGVAPVVNKKSAMLQATRARVGVVRISWIASNGMGSCGASAGNEMAPLNGEWWLPE